MLGLAAVLLCGIAIACRQPPGEEKQEAADPGATAADGITRVAERRAFFGDLHVHTVYSLDAYINGTRLGPRDAYRFAHGEAVALPGGAQQQLATRLDFAAVTDHAEFFAEMVLCRDEEGPGYEHDFCRKLRGGERGMFPALFDRLSRTPPLRHPELCPDPADCRATARGPWQDLQQAAEEFNRPGEFTTFVAYEYSPLLTDFGTLHRNVVFRNASVPEDALSVFDLPTQADLWRWLESACTGDCEVLAIPHNMNLSWGLLFARQNDDGTPYSDEDLQRRARYERIAEIFQIKGSSECALGLGTSDEECTFEQIFALCEEGQETRCARQGSFMRNALLDGLRLEESRGVNPFKQGFIGSTDTHNAIPGAVEEDRFIGSGAGGARPAAEVFTARSPVYGASINVNPGGLAAVWAEANTRDDLFGAMARRETYATSGTRIQLRFFSSWSYPPDLPDRADALAVAYAQGVPMGGDLESARGVGSPRFWIWAARAPDGAALDRVQVVKGWTDDGGAAQEQIWDVACSGDRAPDPATGRCAPTAAGADLTDCSPTGPAGAAQISVTWTDPDFDPHRPSFYYVRAFENPSCRWTTHMAIAAGLEPPEGAPATVQERAWSSPIWYRP